MSQKQLIEKSLEIAKILFESSELHISRSEMRNHLQDGFEQYYDLITKSLCASDKITNKRGKIGGIEYSKGKYRRPDLSVADKQKIEEKINLLFDELKKSEANERQQPELKVQASFKSWFQSETKIQDVDYIYNFRSEARKNGKWRNVDGYYITFEKSDYHLSFKPMLTSFEVKSGMPDTKDISQAENYFNFSHYVYLVFKSSDPTHVILDTLKLADASKLGVFVTNDNVTFAKIHNAKFNQPLTSEVDTALGKILSDSELEIIEGKMLEYLQDKVKLLFS